MADKKTGLALLREPFEAHQISKLPKPYSKDSTKGNCKECGGYHGLPAVHLDYVGHAALTDRLLDCDPTWEWQPLAVAPDGYPVVDKDGGMWIKLTVCGVTRLGYGDAQGKTGGNATKERIGDALRNAAMRFGAALDLWHKGDLHLEDEPPVKQSPAPIPQSPAPNLLPPAHDTTPPAPSGITESELFECIKFMNECTDYEALKGVYVGAYKRADDKQKAILFDIYSAKKALLGVA